MKKILTLLIIQQGDKILLGMKKKGFGAGRWNGFGGKVEAGEEIETAAKRELAEESGLTANNLEKISKINFSWQSKPAEILEVHLFKVREFIGDLVESDEMFPQWFAVDKIPFEQMWADDKYWFPYFLNDKKFEADFIFNDLDEVINYEIKEAVQD